MKPPVLLTARLRLRAFEARDVDGLFALSSDPQVMRYGSHLPWSTRAQAEAKLAEILDPLRAQTERVWVIAEKQTCFWVTARCFPSAARTDAASLAIRC